ncbi:GNAT family N-acetyltransferase [Pseudomonas sp. C27(2019)]|uniref:GNAT family N-acetyltransferase n=1 Tax=Pseudomonas sp. C27(2019) TaxID=2604941 RepID=UPI0021147A62|nr:GNAT family N-acetyltransferase [Pseudomonas sp. C27(2019)]
MNQSFSVQHLAKNQRTLVHKFYRNHNSPMRITQQAEVWVVRAPHIVASVCLSPVAHGHWLTSLLTAPEFRQQGVASLLIKHLQMTYPNAPIWLFCHPDLCSFYSNLGFQQTLHLPDALNSRLTRYQQHKSLIAMFYAKSQEL